MKRIRVIGLVWILLSVPALAGDFDAAAKGIEIHYGIRRVSPRLIGFATFLAKLAMWGSGADKLRIAVFENDGCATRLSARELDQVMLEYLDSRWHPFVHVDSRKDGKAVVIYSNVKGKHMTMLIGSAERSGMSLVQVRINPKAFEEWKANLKDRANGTAHAQWAIGSTPSSFFEPF